MKIVETLFPAPKPDSPWNHLQDLPAQVWWKLAIFVGLIILCGLLIKWYQRIKADLVVHFILAFVAVLVFTDWVYNRGEPKALTPLIDGVVKWAPFMPVKDIHAKENSKPKDINSKANPNKLKLKS